MVFSVPLENLLLKKALTYIFDNFQLEKSKETVADNNVLVGIW